MIFNTKHLLKAKQCADVIQTMYVCKVLWEILYAIEMLILFDLLKYMPQFDPWPVSLAVNCEINLD